MIDLRGLILDMDGVLWRGETPMQGLAGFFETLRRRGVRFVLATNNSTGTVEQYVAKLAGMGVAIEPDQVLTSSCATAAYLATVADPGAPVYVVGEDGVLQALTAGGFRVTAEDARFVVAGLDRHFTYHKLATATALIRQGATFIGTNPDLTLPTPDGPRPGAGAVLAAIRAASGVEPLVIGKPQRPMFEQALARLDTRPEQTAMVGDRLETDISGGQNAGLRTVLVLSGVTDSVQLSASPIRPDWVFEDISALATALGA